MATKKHKPLKKGKKLQGAKLQRKVHTLTTKIDLTRSGLDVR